MNVDARHSSADHQNRQSNFVSTHKPDITPTVDAKAYMDQADAALRQVQMALIKARSLYQARRAEEIVAFSDRLLKMDQVHERECLAMSRMIEKLEAFRS